MRYILIRYFAFAYLAMGIFIGAMWGNFAEKNKTFWFIAWLFSPISIIIVFLYSAGYTLATLLGLTKEDSDP